LAFGYYFGSFTYKGFGLGVVTSTLIAAVIIGQLGISVSGPLKPTFFLMFLFAIGYGVGPQFVRGIASDGLPQALFAAVVGLLCLIARRIWEQNLPAWGSFTDEYRSAIKSYAEACISG
jgi:putative transport protein